MTRPQPSGPLEINLGDYRTSPHLCLGREAGAAARESAGLDEADATGRTVLVYVPPDIYSVTSSFFLGMFEDSIRRCGATDFRRRYKFVGRDIFLTVQDGIEWAALLHREPERPRSRWAAFWRGFRQGCGFP